MKKLSFIILINLVTCGSRAMNNNNNNKRQEFWQRQKSLVRKLTYARILDNDVKVYEPLLESEVIGIVTLLSATSFETLDTKLLKVILKKTPVYFINKIYKDELIKVTALTNAAKNGSPQAVNLLLKYHADPNLNSPLTWAIIYNNHDKFEVCKILLKNGADPNQIDFKNRLNETPLITSINIAGREDAFIKRFSEDDSGDYLKSKIYSEKQYKKILDVIKLLLDYGADPDLIIVNDPESIFSTINFGFYKYKTAYEFAKEQKLNDVVNILENYRK